MLGKLNEVRNQNPALQQLRRITFHQTSNPGLMAYSKVDGDSHVLTVVTLDPDHDVHAEVTIDFAGLGLPGNSLLTVSDQLGDRHTWTWGATNYVHLYPGRVAHIFTVTSA